MSDLQGKKKVLGRGLSALLENSGGEPEGGELSTDFAGEHISRVPVAQIESYPYQPRTHFDESVLRELSASIAEHGIIQPITLRKTGPGRYQLISGERRLKASLMAGLTMVPAFVRNANDEQMLEMALVENIQREDLNPLEIAVSFQRLLDECRLRQEDLSRKVGKARSPISNYIRLLRLPGEVQVAVRDNLISMGHARALINLPDEKTQLLTLKKILERKLSVRQVEDLVRDMGKKGPPPATPPAIPDRFRNAGKDLAGRLGSKIDIRLTARGSGTIQIAFRDPDDLDRILNQLGSE